MQRRAIVTADLALAAARLLAVEVLLTDPKTLGNEVLEADLYLRDRLRGTLSCPWAPRRP
jgi:hypothetical protein